ncbi:hypothetical protein MMUC44124_22815 [Mycolicibacterium mucogenicum DSM 44124]|nr:hypothetical protein MMUC44124_22815 [Mycolicibacterium mucogenicum DSM 44124]
MLSDVRYQRLSQPPLGMLKLKKPLTAWPRLEHTRVTLSPGLYQPFCCALRLASDMRCVRAFTVATGSA